MKVLIPEHRSRAIIRITEALARYAPCEVGRIPPMRNDTPRSTRIPGEEDGDLVVILANGLRDHWLALAARCLARGQRYAVVQIALRTTRHPNTSQWRHLWAGAATVWSYYPLELWIDLDGGASMDFDFYHAPLGADASVFTMGNCHRPYTVCTSGRQRNQEGVAECDDAAFAVGGIVFQVGPTLALRSTACQLSEIDDATLAGMYQQCQFVSGLRRTEGFEMPAAEGLLCGARPLLYDRPHYRDWYGRWGEFIPEDGTATERLTHLFRSGPRPVTAGERAEAAKLFDWERICRNFWERCGA